MTKAISLLSGGLDSILATKLILNQGIDVEAITFSSVFCPCHIYEKDCKAGKQAAQMLGVKHKVFEISQELIEIVKNPKYGYGSNINPCIDCHAFMFKKASEYMRQIGAQFLITGEVLGERPMSQRKDALKIVEKESLLGGYLLRPLSAKLLDVTVPEKEGLVDRNKLLAIKGRGRKQQFALAKEFGIDSFPTPAGGCLLTDPGFANRMRDLIKYKPNFAINDVWLLKLGRHFRLSKDAKLVVGRNEKENNILLTLAENGDLCLYPTKAKGPIGIGRGILNKDILSLASSIIVRYSDKDEGQQLEVAYKQIPNEKMDYFTTLAAGEEKVNSLRI